MPRRSLLRVRGGTAAEWNAANPVLEARELGLETDTRKLKAGDGTSTWGDLDYLTVDGVGGGGGGLVQADLDAHAADTTSVHGIADTSLLATITYVDTAVAAVDGGGVEPDPGWSVAQGYEAVRLFDPTTTTPSEMARVLATLIDALKGLNTLSGEEP